MINEKWIEGIFHGFFQVKFEDYENVFFVAEDLEGKVYKEALSSNNLKLGDNE